MINSDLSKRVLTIGVYYKNNAPGGMASVAASYEKYFSTFMYISTWRLGGKTVKIWYVIKALIVFCFTMLFNKDIQIVHIHTAAHNSFFRKSLFVRLAKKYNKKVIMHIHASQFKDFYKVSDKKQQIVNILNTCDKIIVLSQSWKDFFIGIDVDSSRLEVLNNIVSPPEKIKVRKDVQIPLRFLFLGEIGDRKGIFDLLEAIALNRDEFSQKIHLEVGGNGEVERFKKAVKSKNLEEFITFLGWTSGEAKHEALLSADVYILPSHNEGLPISILEAMSYGLPVISTNVGGIPEVVRVDYNGYIIQAGNKEQIIKAISIFVNNIDLVRTLGRNSLKIVESYYPPSVFRTLNGIYSELLSDSYNNE